MRNWLADWGKALGWRGKGAESEPGNSTAYTWKAEFVPGQYPDGIDAVWLGIDSKGQVAAFTTAGEGLIPSSVVEQGEPAFRLIEDTLDGLEKIGRAEMQRELKLKPNDYERLAVKGIFAYDWSWSGTYCLVAAPTVPTNVGDLPSDAREALKSLVMAAEFGKDDNLDVSEFFACAAPQAR